MFTSTILFQNSNSKTLMVLQVSVDETTSYIDFKAFPDGHRNRILDRYGMENFLIVNFKLTLKSSIVRNILQRGVRINGSEYQFLGCSSSGLKERTCYMYRGSVSDVDRVLAECGSFYSIKSKSALLKRIGLLFSAAIPTGIEIPDESIHEEDDIENMNGNFTDGCGAVSMDLAKQITRSSCKGLPSDGKYLPSVYQIRYQGCKGVVMVDPKLEGECLVIRPSMKKFASGSKPFKELWLCDYSRPYTFGHLNRQFIMLLSSLGVEDEVFLRVQEEHFHLLTTMKHDSTSAFQLLQFDNQPEQAFRCFEGEKQSERQLSSLRKKLVSQLHKLRLLVPKSRNVFGVCDPTGKLQYGECFFRYTEGGYPKTLHGAVVVAKNPCYLLGDVRVLQCVPIHGLEHLVDCVVFPTNGKRPHPSEIAGSDLDGDQYFVCWDEDLVVLRTREPYNYPSISAPETTSEVTRSVLIDYFASYKNSMGKIDSYYKKWANKRGAGCSECQHLGMLFSRSVDASKTGDQVHIPDRLKPDNLESPTTLHVWEEMDKRVEEIKIVLTISDKIENSIAIDEIFIWDILQNKYPNLSDYQLFRFLLRWCSRAYSNMDDGWTNLKSFAKYLNFGEFTVDQQVEAIDAGIPMDIITNALNKSSLFPPSLLHKFLYYDPHRAWRFYLRSSSSDFNWEHLLRGLQNHPESIVVIKLPEEIICGVTFVLHFLEPPELGEGKSVGDGSIAVYFSSSHFNLDEQRIVGSQFTLDLTEDTLQLYRGKNNHGKNKFGTFVWMGSGSKVQNQAARISVDLTRFKRDVLTTDNHPTVKKVSVSSIEVFVKSRSQDPAYLDIVEAPDLEVGELSHVEEFEEIPSDSDDDDDCSEFNILEPYSLQDAMSMLLQSAKNGQPREFQAILSTITDKEQHSVPEAFIAFQDLLIVMVKKFCHKSLDSRAVDSLQIIITCLSHQFTNPLDCLQLLSSICLLHHSDMAGFTLDKIFSNISVSTKTDLFEMASNWKLWYFLQPLISSKFAEYFYTLYRSRWSIQDKNSSEHEVGGADDHTQHDDALQYTSLFTYALLLNLLSEMSSHDKTVQLEKMKVYCSQTSSRDRNGGERDNKAYTVGFSRTAAGISSVKFSEGSYVAIIIMKKSKSGGLTVLPLAVGTIVKISRQPADILVEVEEPVPQCLERSAKLQRGHWQLSLIANITGYKRTLKALNALSQNPSCTALSSTLILSYTCGRSSPLNLDKDVAACPSLSAGMPLNRDQEEAVKAAIQQRLTLVHGPPGTGKTHVACEIVKRQLALDSSTPILVTAETNLAVDNLCEKLLPLGIRVVRIGRLDQISRSIRKISLEGQVEQKRVEEGKDKSRSSFPSTRMVKQVLRAAQVVATTCTGAGDAAIEGMKFPFVIIDEATQVTEPTSLIPLVHGCQQLTLIGDPEQLGPMNQAVVKSMSDGLETDCSLSESLFHRLNKTMPSFFLSEQHRMHQKLAAFPSRKFYDGKLVTAPSCCSRESTRHIPFLEPHSPSVFLDICQDEHCREKRTGTSFHNLSEVNEIIKVIKYLTECQVSTQDMAVLTPYSGQVRSVSEALGQEKLSQVRAYTIDGFQGREVDYVVFSTVRCNDYGDLGFTDDKYRMNVLLTRARHGIIGIGCRKTLSLHSELWKEWFEGVKICRTVEDESEDQNKKVGDQRKDQRRDQRRGRMRGGHVQSSSRSDSDRHDLQHRDRDGMGERHDGAASARRGWAPPHQRSHSYRGWTGREAGGEQGARGQRRNGQSHHRGRNAPGDRPWRSVDHRGGGTRRRSRQFRGGNTREE